MAGGKLVELKKKSLPARMCKVCGDLIEFTRRSARDWDTLEYCSAACRRTGVSHQRMAAAG